MKGCDKKGGDDDANSIEDTNSADIEDEIKKE